MNLKTRHTLLIIFLLSLLLPGVHAASFRHLTLEDGLSSRQVFQICKDSAGFVWMFTHLGVDRYDGNTFRHYTLDETLDAKDYILSSTVMACDRSGQLWVALKNGKLFRYDDLKDTFVAQTGITEQFADNTTLNEIYFDDRNRLWLCLSDGLYCCQPERDCLLQPVSSFYNEHVTRIVQATKEEFFVGTNAQVYSLKVDADGTPQSQQLIPVPGEVRVESFHFSNHKLYIGTFGSSLFIWDTTLRTITSLHAMIPTAPVRSILLQGKEVWIATDGSGIYCIDAISNQFLRRFNADADNRNSLSGNTVSDLLIDERQWVWITTYSNGVTIFEPEYPEIKRITHEQAGEQSLLSNHVNVIMEDADGDIWYGTNDGISLYRTETDRWTHYLKDKGGDSDRSNVILALCEDGRNRVWTGGYGVGVFCIDKRTDKVERVNMQTENLESPEYKADYIYSIYAEGNYIWLGGIEGDFTRYHILTGKTTHYPFDCIGDVKAGHGNNLLLAGCGGLGFFNKSDGTTRWHRSFNDTTLRYPVRCLLQASDQTIWLATDGEGLIHFNLNTHTSQFYTTKHGISSNSVNGLVEDKNGDIWFTTEKNLYKLDQKTGIILSMNEFIGVEWGSYNPNACIVKKNGHLALGTAEGVIEFSPDFNTHSDEAIRLLFTDFKLLYKTVQADSKDSPLQLAIDKTRTIGLRYEQNSFSLSFSAVNFLHRHQIHYFYRLEGFDEAWQPADSRRSVGYMNLSPGKYTFELKAVQKYTQQTLDSRKLEIRIGNPFWVSMPAIMLYLLLLLVLFFLLFQYSKHKLAEHNAKEKIRFFINIAHDIRTPVTLIKAPLSELEAEEHLSEEGRKSLLVASRNVDKLLGMVTQLLDLQKVDSRKERLSVHPQDIYIFMQEKMVNFRPAAIQKGTDLLLEISPGFPEVWFDKRKMDVIADNILSNAIKYTENGYVSIQLTFTEKEWSVVVRDSGIGIPAGEQKQIFKQFYRAENAVNHHENGSGIGLLLTRKLVEMHKGSICFTSVENEGTIFTLTFPLKIAEAATGTETADHLPASGQPLPASTTKEVLLLAEDNEELRHYLTERMAQEYHVITADSGTKLLELAREMNPDIIVSDIVMPEMWGDEACRILKSSIETSHIPFILLSALSEKENVIHGLESGANDYIIKPFDFNVLRARIRNILHSREQMRKAVLSADEQVEENSYANVLDKQFLENAVRIIEEHLSEPEFSINDFCMELGMSRTSVYNKIKSLTDQGPNDFIRIIRLNKAKELLKTKMHTISEVSTMVGFSDPKYFSTSFKKQFGVSPSKLLQV